MPDPFRPNPKSQLIREAQIGLSVVAILLTLFLYVAFYKLTGRGQHLPEHVRNAPVAERVWPGAMPPHKIEMSPREFLDFRRSGLSQRKQYGNPDNRMPSGDRELLDPREPPLGPAVEIDLALNQKSLDSSSPAQSSIVPSVPSKFEMPRAKSVPYPVTAETQAAPGIGEQLKMLLGGFEPEHDTVSGATDSTRIAPLTEVAVAAAPSVQPSFDSTASEADDSEAWIPPLPPNTLNDNPTDFAPEVRLTSAETDDTDFVPAVEIGSAPSQAKTEADEFNPGGEFNANSDFPIAEQQNQSALEAIAEPSIPPATDLDTANELDISNLTKLEISVPDLPDGDWPESESKAEPNHNPELKLVAPKPFTNTHAQTAQRQLPRPEASPMAGSDWPERIHSGNPSSAGAEAESVTTPRQSLTYIVREGDNFWSIAQSLYGDGRYFRALYKYNETTVPEFNSLATGTKIGTPLKEDLAKIWPDLCPQEDSDQVSVDENPSDADDRIYVTQAGDTLFDIARQKLGQASRYLEIKRMNDVRLESHIKHYSPLRQGVRLVLPAQ